MRRHEPRISPNSTRELGPIEATIRESLLAPARITTQCRETERTHRTDLRGAGEAARADFVGVVGATTGAVGVGAVFGITSLTTLGLAAVSRGILSVTTIGVRAGALSVVATTIRAVVVSVLSGSDNAADAGGGSGFDRLRSVSSNDPLRNTHTAPTRTTTAAPAPRQMRGLIGGRSGFVPHHRHDPALAG